MQTQASIEPPPTLCATRSHFRSDHYVRINQRRLEHLATLGLVRPGMRILEPGAGIGDLTDFFLDRGCTVTLAEGREDNLEVCRQRFDADRRVEIRALDLDDPGDPAWARSTWDLVFAYGLLYHLRRPAEALAWMADRCADLLILETCVTPGAGSSLNPIGEDAAFGSQALHGLGCRPTRPWVAEHLRHHLAFVYCLRTQPNHDEFPLDWADPRPSRTGLYRAIFVASRRPLGDHPLLIEGLPGRHTPSP